MKSDLMIPNELTVTDLAAANTAGRAWMGEVNTVEHSQIVAVPAERLDTERPLLGPLPSNRKRVPSWPPLGTSTGPSTSRAFV